MITFCKENSLKQTKIIFFDNIFNKDLQFYVDGLKGENFVYWGMFFYLTLLFLGVIYK